MRLGTIRPQNGAALDRASMRGQAAYDYGRNIEPLPDIYLFSVLTERDAAYADDLSRRRARLETLARDVEELGARLAADVPGDGAAPRALRRGWFGRRRAGPAQGRAR